MIDKIEYQPDEKGWEQRTITEEPRLSEIVEFYKELGFEVEVRDYKPESEEDSVCNSCLLVSTEKYKVVYTRQK